MADELVMDGGGSGSDTPATGTPSGGQPVPSTGTPGPVPGTPAMDRYELKVNGKVVPVEGRDKVVEYAQKGYYFTQSMQDLAAQRKAFEAEREQIYSEVRTLLNDPKQLRQWLAQIEQTQGPAAASAAADELLTAAQAKEMLQRELQQFAGMTQQELQSMRMQFEVDQLAGQYTQSIDGHLGTLKGQFPELTAIPNVEKALKATVLEMGPKNLQEAQHFMSEVAQQWAGQVRQHLDTERKKAAAPPALTRGIEPPGGAGPMPPAAPAFKSTRDPGFRDAVMRELIEASKST